jgi:hypothetical protein
MRKVRTRHEDIFIGKMFHLVNRVAISDPILEKYHFNYNTRWISNPSNTKRIEIRKMKAFPMTFVCEVIIGYADKVINPQNMINYSIAHSFSSLAKKYELMKYRVLNPSFMLNIMI